MPVLISMLRGINVGSRHRIKMEDLRALYESLDFRNPRTFIQSGNVVFEAQDRKLEKIRKRIEEGIEQRFGFHSDVILRTVEEMKDAIERDTFAGRENFNPGKLVIVFLAADPGMDAIAQVRAMKVAPEELRIGGRELYVYYPNGMGRSKFPMTAIAKILKTEWTGRNWNSVTKLLELAGSFR